MSKFVVPVQIEVSAYSVADARSYADSALRRGTQEKVILSGRVTGDPEECICLTTSELNARIEAAVTAATSKTTPASA